MQSQVQERLQLKREPLDKWSLREKLCLASAVSRSGADQNWMSVSRAIKAFAEPNRPADWMSQKNCAAQYNALLSNVETPKRKSRNGQGETVVETPAECILKKLVAERKAELQKLLAEEKSEYKKLQENTKLLKSGRATEEQIDNWCKEIDEEEFKREQDSANHAKWLKQRDMKKQEIEKAFKSNATAPFAVAGQKRKLSDENTVDNKEAIKFLTTTPPPTTQQQKSYFDIQQQLNISQQEPAKPALSPLLTSLLKSPSQVQNITSASSSILHSVITSQANNSSKMAENSPAITSLLNTSRNVAVNLQQQFTAVNKITDDPNQPLDLLDDANIKIDDLAKSILEDDGPFPEIKKEEVDDIISEIIDNHDIVDDPEQHLQLDKNGDININLEIDDLEVTEPEPIVDVKKENDPVKPEVKIEKEKPAPVIDPFEFQEDPVIFESPVKPSTLKQDYVPLYQQSPVKSEERKSIEAVENPIAHGSVEIVEVKTEDKVNDTVLNKTQICDIVHNVIDEVKDRTDETIENPEVVTSETVSDQEVVETKKSLGSPDSEQKDNQDSSDTNTVAQNENNLSFSDDLYDDNINMEVKIDKTGRTKRDYSRTKKKEEKSFDMLLMAMEKGHFDSTSQSDDNKAEKRSVQTRLKSDSERSFSPWTEDEDSHSKPPKAETPVDSFPNSPASSIAFYEDDKEHRNWKKSVMLVYNRLITNRYASLFLKPITNEQAPDYSNMVYKPMDLLTIKKNIDSGIIRTSLEFKREVMLMFQNAIMYNKTNSTVYNMALQMQQESLNPIEILLQAEGQVETPARRETRTSESGSRRRSRIPDEGGKKKKKED